MSGENPDWLPAGWKVSVKVGSFGRRDKYYIHPSNGLKFNSKPEVLRYLEKSGKEQKPKQLNKVNIEKTVAENLPPGWIKEIHTKKKAGKTRRDPYYIDPVSGNHFRSMREVFRYLESKDSKKPEPKPEPDDKDQRLMDKKAVKVFTRRQTVNSGRNLARSNVNLPKDKEQKEEEDDSLATELYDKLQMANGLKQRADKMRKIEKFSDDKVDKSVDGDQKLKSGSKVAKLKKIDTENKERNSSVARNLRSKPPQVSGKEQSEVGKRQSKRFAGGKLKDDVVQDQSLKSGSEGAAVGNITMPETIGKEQREKQDNSIGKAKGHQQEKTACQYKRRNRNNSKCTSSLSRRTSKRLANVEVKVDPPLEVKPAKKARPTDEPKFPKSNEPNEPPAKKPVTSPLENISSLVEHKGPILDSTKDESPEKQNFDSALSDLLMDPCIEFAIKTLTGAIPIEDLKKVCDSPVSSSRASPNQKTPASSSILPSGDIWADPCFEFAVKTLTGDSPMDSGSKFQLSFEKPNGLNLPKFRLDNYYPPPDNSVNQFDVVKKTHVMQQGARDPHLPHAINGSM